VASVFELLDNTLDRMRAAGAEPVCVTMSPSYDVGLGDMSINELCPVGVGDLALPVHIEPWLPAGQALLNSVCPLGAHGLGNTKAPEDEPVRFSEPNKGAFARMVEELSHEGRTGEPVYQREYLGTWRLPDDGKPPPPKGPMNEDKKPDHIKSPAALKQEAIDRVNEDLLADEVRWRREAELYCELPGANGVFSIDGSEPKPPSGDVELRNGNGPVSKLADIPERRPYNRIVCAGANYLEDWE